jgi:hypothetical protein
MSHKPAVAANGDLALRDMVLRFPTDAPEASIAEAVEAWNRRFLDYFEGAGHFSDTPEIEMFSEGDEVVSCLAYYLYADECLWNEIRHARTLTIDEPVLARQVAAA